MNSKITRKDQPELFKTLIKQIEIDWDSKEHRRGSNFYVLGFVYVDEKYFPELESNLYGTYMSNTFVWDDDNGYDSNDIYELEKGTFVTELKTIEVKSWVPAED